jgi:hypothetical protein
VKVQNKLGYYSNRRLIEDRCLGWTHEQAPSDIRICRDSARITKPKEGCTQIENPVYGFRREWDTVCTTDERRRVP